MEPGLQHPWMFDSMIDASKQGEYELLACRLVAPTIAHREFNPFAYPYGGTGCMKALEAAPSERITPVAVQPGLLIVPVTLFPH